MLHNRRVAVQDIEQELREDYREKFPQWLNAKDLEALCLFIVTANLLDHYSREWLEFNKPKIRTTVNNYCEVTGRAYEIFNPSKDLN